MIPIDPIFFFIGREETLSFLASMAEIRVTLDTVNEFLNFARFKGKIVLLAICLATEGKYGEHKSRCKEKMKINIVKYIVRLCVAADKGI